MTRSLSQLIAPTAALAAAFLPAAASAQRGAPSLQHTRLSISLDHGKPPVGDHGLDELPVGQSWRLGMNTASTLRAELPIVAGDVVVAPGHYRINLLRSREQMFALQVDHAGAGLGTGDASAQLLGGWSEANKPSKKLEIAFHENSRKRPKAEDAVEGEPDAVRFGCTIRYGENRVDVPFEVIGAGKTQKIGSHELRPFAWPTSRALGLRGAGKPLVLGTLVPRRDPGDDAPAFHNLVLVGDQLHLVPAPNAPTEQFGFGALESWDPAWASEAAVQWSEPQEETAGTTTVVEAEFDKKTGLAVTFVVGDRIGGATLPLPAGPK